LAKQERDGGHSHEAIAKEGEKSHGTLNASAR
jgi:hypothetical protein